MRGKVSLGQVNGGGGRERLLLPNATTAATTNQSEHTSIDEQGVFLGAHSQQGLGPRTIDKPLEKASALAQRSLRSAEDLAPHVQVDDIAVRHVHLGARRRAAGPNPSRSSGATSSFFVCASVSLSFLARQMISLRGKNEENAEPSGFQQREASEKGEGIRGKREGDEKQKSGSLVACPLLRKPIQPCPRRRYC